MAREPALFLLGLPKPIHTMPYKKNPRERHGAELLFLRTETAPKSQKAHLLI
jgi:hypothetical protein